MQKLQCIQAARGIAALMVVMFHSLSIQHKYLADTLLPDILRFGQTGVDLFFVISGFVMILTTQSSVPSLSVSLRFIRKRFRRIYPTYWVYCIALVIVMHFAPGILNSSQGGEVDLISSFLLIPNDKLPIVMVAWTLTHELWFYLVFALLLLATAQVRLLSITLWLAIIFAVSLMDIEAGPTLRVITHEFTLEFLFGALAAYAFNALRNRRQTQCAAVIALIMAAACLLAGLYWVNTGGPDTLQIYLLERALLLGGGYALLILAISLFESSLKDKPAGPVQRLLTALGDMSYSLYLSHILTLSLCGRVWKYLGPSMTGWSIGSPVFWTMTYLICLSGGYVAYRLIERPLLIWTSRRTGAGRPI